MKVWRLEEGRRLRDIVLPLKNHRDASVRPLALDLSPTQGGMVPWTGNDMRNQRIQINPLSEPHIHISWCSLLLPGGGGVPAANSLTLVCSATNDMIFVVLGQFVARMFAAG